MTRVDFYILGAASNDSRLRIACRIAEKAVRQRHHVFVNSGTREDARKLDELLWTFSQGSFVPHALVDEAAAGPREEPVLIGADVPESEDDAAARLGENWDLMINLAPAVPSFFSRYARVAEVVDSDPARKQQGRDRYRFYRDRGYALETHNV